MPSGRTQVIHGQSKEIALSALTAKTAIVIDSLVDANTQQGHTLQRFRLYWEMKGKTAYQGPIVLGISSGMSIANLAEALQADPQLLGSPESEEGNRKVYPLYVIGDAATAVGNPASQIANHLKMRNEPAPSWKTVEGQALEIFAWNADTADLTTGTLITVIWSIVIKWEMD